MTPLDLALFALGVYGFAWGVTRSALVSPVRALLEDVVVLGKLVHCIVCFGFWVSVVLALLIPRCSVFSEAFRGSDFGGRTVVVFATVALVWALGSKLGDAE